MFSAKKSVNSRGLCVHLAHINHDLTALTSKAKHPVLLTAFFYGQIVKGPLGALTVCVVRGTKSRFHKAQCLQFSG